MNPVITLAKKHLLNMPENNGVLKADLIKVIRVYEELEKTKNESKEKEIINEQFATPLDSELTSLIDDYKIRLAKIERSANRIKDRTVEKVWKESAAEQTKRFIKELNRIQRSIRFYRESALGDLAELISESDIQSQEESK